MGCKIICVACEWTCVVGSRAHARKCAGEIMASGKHDNCGRYAIRIYEAPSYVEVPLKRSLAKL